VKKIVEVNFGVRVLIDETKFTSEFMQEFREYFYDFKTIDDHVKHLAQLEVRGLLDDEFTEGYGNLSNMGIKVQVIDTTMEIGGIL